MQQKLQQDITIKNVQRMIPNNLFKNGDSQPLKQS